MSCKSQEYKGHYLPGSLEHMNNHFPREDYFPSRNPCACTSVLSSWEHSQFRWGGCSLPALALWDCLSLDGVTSASCAGHSHTGLLLPKESMLVWQRPKPPPLWFNLHHLELGHHSLSAYSRLSSCLLTNVFVLVATIITYHKLGGL